MARFAPISDPTQQWQSDDQYPLGFASSTKDYAVMSRPGLSEGVVEQISHHKEEPEWMRAKRLQALQIFYSKPMPPWGPDLSGIRFDDIHYYLRPLEKTPQTWADVPADIKTTFERIGVPQAEREQLAGVKMQYDSEVIYGSLKKTWEKDGVIFLSMDEALRQHPDLVKEYFGTVIPMGDNKFAALNTAVWSGGSFVYVPPGVHVSMPLQTYFRINAPNAGQFERTLIIVDEGAKVHYVEGCFVAGSRVKTKDGHKKIEDITLNDQVLTHTGKYQQVYNLQKRPYSGKIFTLKAVGIPQTITATEEHPFLVVKRRQKNERNIDWTREWYPVSGLRKNDYLCIPIEKKERAQDSHTFTFPIGKGGHGGRYTDTDITVPSTPEFFRLAGYYLAEGSISSGHYLSFSFNENERELIDEVKLLLRQVFGIEKTSEFTHKKNHGTSVVVSSTLLCRLFEHLFSKGAKNKKIPEWMMSEAHDKQKELIATWFLGDGNYYNKQHPLGKKEIFRICTISQTLAEQGQMMMARLGVASGINVRDRSKEGRNTMYTLVIGGNALLSFANIVDISVDLELNGKARATRYFIDENYLYSPIQSIEETTVENVDVFNFSVEKDESYTVEGCAVHNCTAPAYSASALHSAVVEIVVKKGAHCQYTTIQNWYKTVYNLVTKRATVDEEGEMIWTDCNLGSKVTMKYPSFILKGKGARGETLSMAVAGAGQHQDTGSKAIHLAPHTSSTIISKSISKGGGRASYRGLVHIGPNAHGSKNKVVCDALILDPQSQTDTYPTERVFTNDVQLEHEATVSRIGEEQLFYLMTRGLTEEEAGKMIVRGFTEPLIRKLPLEYAVEMNRLIDLEMEGSVG